MINKVADMVWIRTKANLGPTSILFFVVVVASVSAQEFLSVSIDCGASRGYTDGLKISWDPDEPYIGTGENTVFYDLQDVFFTARVFPEGRSKNCYELPVKNQTTYLLRAQFYPGDKNDGDNTEIAFPVSFSVFLNSNLWFTYLADANDTRGLRALEAIFHAADSNEVFVCLVKGEAGTPFINSLELRELPPTSYFPVKSHKKIFRRFTRLNFGTNPDASTLRYPDDEHDRYWWPTPPDDPFYAGIERVENLDFTPPRLQSALNGYNWPPAAVLRDAWVGNFSLSYQVVGPVQFYATFHVMEIRPQVNSTAIEADPVGMNITVGGAQADFNFTSLRRPATLSLFPLTILESGYFEFNVTVETQPWSRFPAIVNGFEMYRAFDVNDSATNLGDQKAVKAVKQSLGLEDWTGDPCFPVPWDWVTCDFDTFRITELQLSKKNISGTLPTEIGELSEVTEIYLNNNNLTGSIPESLGSLRKLKVLALDDNNLSGEIPTSLRDVPGFTFEGNANLCPLENNPCNASISPPPPAPPDSGALAVHSTFTIFSLLAVLFLHLTL